MANRIDPEILQGIIQEGQVWVADDRASVQLDPNTILAAKPEWS